jgi:hypothetical protein
MDTAADWALVPILNFAVEGSSHFGRSNGRPRANISLSRTSSLIGRHNLPRAQTSCVNAPNATRVSVSSCGLRWE